MRAVRQAEEVYDGVRQYLERYGVDIARAAETTQAAVEAARGITLPFATLSSDAAVMAQYAARTAAHYQAIFDSTSFQNRSIANIFAEVERVRPLLETYAQQIAEAPDELSQWSRIREVAQDVTTSAIELTLGTTINPQSRKERIMLYVAILIFLIQLVSNRIADARRGAEIGDLRILIHDQAHTITLLTDTLRQMQDEIGVKGPVLRVTKTARLREGPDSQSRRLRTLKAGERVEKVTVVKRWYYVEVLTQDGHRTGLRGWVYRRNVQWQ